MRTNEFTRKTNFTNFMKQPVYKKVLLLMYALTMLIAPRAKAQDIYADLALHLSFSNSLADESTNGLTVNNIGGATFTTDRYDLVDSAMSFDGVDDYLQIPHANGLSTGINYTVSFWVKSSKQTNQWIWVKGNTILRYQINMGATGALGHTVVNGSAGFKSVASETGFNDGEWHFVVFRRYYVGTETVIDVWVDNEFQNVTYTGFLNMSTNDNVQELNIGKYYNHSQDYFQGSLDDMRLYKRKLTEDEMSILFNEKPATLNEDPIQTAALPDTLHFVESEPPQKLYLSNYFEDPEGIPLLYMAGTNTDTIVNTSIDGEVLSVTPIVEKIGIDTVNVMATDSYDTISVPFIVNVVARDTLNLESGLYAYYPFKTNADDESGFDNNTTQSYTSLGEDRFDIPNSALDGSAIMNLAFASQYDNTVSMWLKPDVNLNSSSSAYVFLEHQDNFIARYAGGLFIFGGNHQKNLAIDFNAGQWYHIVMSMDNGGDCILYVDTTAYNLGSYTGTYYTTSKSMFMGRNYTGTVAFPGTIDDIRFYRRTLTDQEIVALYDEVKTNLTPVKLVDTTHLSYDELAEYVIDIPLWYEDPEDASIYASATNTNPNITISVSGDSLIINAVNDYFGLDTVFVEVTDSVTTLYDTLYIDIQSVNDEPFFTFDSDTVRYKYNFTDTKLVNLILDHPANESDQTITYTMAGDTLDFVDLNIDANTGQISINSVPGLAGDALITVTADDGQAENNIYTRDLLIQIQGIFLDSSMYAHYPFNGNSVDATGTMGTLSLLSNSSPMNYVSDHNGVPGGAAHFSNSGFGTNSYNTNLVEDGYSVQTWIYPTFALNGSIALAVMYEHSLGSGLYYNAGNLRFDLYDAGGTQHVFTLDTVFDPNQWIHIVATVKAGEKVRFYINNEEFIVGDAPASIRKLSQTIWIGSGWYIAPKDGFPGYIDEMRFYGRELNPFEVDSLYTLPNVPAERIQEIPSLTLPEDFEAFQHVDLDTIIVDPEGFNLSYNLVFDSTEMMASITSESILNFASVQDFNGDAELTIEAFDGLNTTSEAFQITVDAVDDIPAFEISADYLYLDRNFADTSVVVTSMHPLDEDTVQTVMYTLEPEASTIGFADITFDTSTGLVSIQSVADTFGIQEFVITAMDDSLSYQQSFTLEVKNPAFDGLIAYYPFNGDANTALPGENIELNGTVYNAVYGLDRLNRSDSAIYFDGDTDYIDVADNDAIDFDDNLDFSFAFWFKTPKSTTNQMFFDKGANPRYYANVTSTGNIRFILAYGGSNYEEIITPDAYDDNLWHHVALTADRDGDAKIYVDGEEKASVTLSLTGTLSTTYGFRFGSQSNQGAWFYKGFLDDFYAYNRVLTAEDVAFLATVDRPTFLRIASVSPANNSIIHPDDTIRIHFNKQVNADSAANLMVYGDLSGVRSGTVTANNHVSFVPDQPYIEGEKISVFLPKTMLAQDGDTLIKPMSYRYTVQTAETYEYPAIYAGETAIDAAISGKTAMVPGDIDGDGDIDLVAISQGEGKVTVYNNDGAASFTQSNISTSRSDGSDVKLADLDNDGDLDVVLGYTNNVGWYENDGSGNFGALTLIATPNFDNIALNVADVDVDGDIDIVINGGTSGAVVNKVYVAKNEGDGSSFSSLLTVWTPPGANSWEAPKEVTLANIDADPQLEIAIATQAQGGAIRVFQPNEDYTAFSTFIAYSYPYDFGQYSQGAGMAVTAADFNGDGFDDLMIGSSGANGSSRSKIHYLQANGTGGFNAATDVLILAEGWKNYYGLNLKASDLDGDGDQDLIHYGYDSKLGWIENENGSFSESKSLNTTATPALYNSNWTSVMPYAADIDGDGMVEVIAATGSKLIYHKAQDGLSLISSMPADGAMDAAADGNISLIFDFDLNPVTVGTSTVQVSGSKSGTVSSTISVIEDTIRIDPVNNLIAGESITIILTNTIAGLSGEPFNGDTVAFTIDQLRLVGSYPLPGQGMVKRDTAIHLFFDRDIDAASIDSSSIRIHSHYRSHIRGSYQVTGHEVIFTPEIPFLANENVKVSMNDSIMATDGNISNFNYLEFFVGLDTINEGSVNFVSKSLGDQSTQIARIALPGDLDNDGDLDIVFNDENNGLWNWLENTNGGLSFGPTTEFASGDAEVDFNGFLEDIDENGSLDLMLIGRTEYLGWINNGEVGNSYVDIINTTNYTEGRGVDVSDIDKDGKKDVVTSYLYNNNIVVYKLGEDQNYETSMTVASGISSPFDVKFFDMNQDGYDDIIYTAYGNYRVYLLTNNQDGTFTQQDLGYTGAPTYIDVYDLDLDGDPDIVVGNDEYDESIAVFENNGDESYNYLTFPAAERPVFVKVGDINADGMPDIVYNSLGNNQIEYLRNTGDMTFDRDTIAQNVHGYFIELADIDADGDLDVVTANNWAETNNRVFVIENLMIDFNEAPAIVNQLEDIVTDEDAGEQIIADTVLFTDPDGDDLTISILNENEDIQVYFAGENDTLRLNTTDDYFGTTTVTIRAYDGVDSTDMSFQVTVNPVNDAPFFTLENESVTVDEDFETMYVKINPIQPENEVEDIGYAISPAIDFAQVSFNDTALVITAIENEFGSQVFTITANDSASANNTYTKDLSLTVNAVDDAPVIELSATEVTVSEDFTGDVSVSVTTIHPENEEQELVYSISPATNTLIGVTFDDETGNILFTPIANAFGSQNFIITVDDGVNPATAAFTVTVDAVNDAPVFELSHEVLNVGQNFETPVSVYVTDLSPDNEADQSINYSIDPASVGFVNLSLNPSTGEITFTAVADASGSEEFTVTADDGQDSENTYTQTFTVNVLENQPPVLDVPISDFSYPEDTEYALLVSDLTTHFSDPEGENLSFSFESDNEDFDVFTTGTDIYIEPAVDYFGTANITVTASDGNSFISDEFIVEITAVNDAPYFSLSTSLLVLETDFTTTEIITVTPEAVPENETEQEVIYSLDPATVSFASVSIEATTGEITITSVAGATGSQEFMVYADDQQEENNLVSQSFTLTVSAENAAPTDIQLSNNAVAENAGANTQVGLLTSSDIDNSTFTYSLVTGEGDADNNKFAISNDALYTNTMLNYEETDVLSIRIMTDDGSGGSFEKVFSVFVLDMNDVPTDITLSNNQVAENVAVGTVVGTFSAEDEDEESFASEAAFSFATDNESNIDEDNDNFNINGVELALAVVPDFEEQMQHSIFIMADDLNGGVYYKAFTIEITDEEETSAPDLQETFSVQIFPNPTDGRFFVKGKNKAAYAEASLRIYNLSGELISAEEITGSDYLLNVDISDQPSGTYLLQFHFGEESFTHRIILD